MSEFKRSYQGYEVRRQGVDFVGGFPSDVRRPIGIVVERHRHPEPQWPGTADKAALEAWHTDRNVIDGFPAQVAVYW